MYRNQIFEIQDYYSPQMQREIFDLIDKVYFKDYSIENDENSNSGGGGDESGGEVGEDEAATASDDKPRDGKRRTIDDDVSGFELNKLNKTENGLLDKELIKTTIKNLHIQQDVVGRKCSDIILQNSRAYSVELKRVSDFKGLLEDSYQICAIARHALSMSEYMFVLPSLKLVKKQIKKSHLIKLYNTVNEIKSFHNSAVHISELIRNREFSKAIGLCIENEKIMGKYEHLKCIKGLRKTVRDYYDTIEESMEAALSKLCRQQNYDETLLDEIFTAYCLLDKCDDFFEMLGLSVVNAVNVSAAETLIGVGVHSFVLSERLTSKTKENQAKVNAYVDELKRREFAQLFDLISTNQYKSTLVSMCMNLWQIMKNYYRMTIFIYESCQNKSHQTSSMSLEKLEPKLSADLNRTWQGIQLKLSTFFRSMSLDHFKFDELIDLLIIINRFVELGYEFCNHNSNSRILVDAAKDQTLAYFRAYHINHLEELKMFLENEMWQWCPVRSDFSIYKLNEYKFLQDNDTKSAPNNQILLKSKKINILNLCASDSGVGGGERSDVTSTTYDETSTTITTTTTTSENAIGNKMNHSSSSSSSASTASLLSNGSSSHADTTTSLSMPSSPKLKFEINPAFMLLMKDEDPFGARRTTSNGEEKMNGSGSNPFESGDDQLDEDENKNVLVRKLQQQQQQQHVSNGNGAAEGEDNEEELENSNHHDHHQQSDGVVGKNSALSNANSPILTNTTLNVIRLFGKYIHMLSIFKIISHQVITYLMQLFQFYFYYIYLDFTQQQQQQQQSQENHTERDTPTSVSANSLQVIIKSIKTELFSTSKLNISEPKISSIKAVNNRQDYLECINQRIVAAESLIFLAQEIEGLFPLIASFVPDSASTTSMLATYQAMLNEIPKIREPIYLFVANMAFDWTQMFEMVARVNWDLHEILSQHNAYVDMLLRQMQKMIADIEGLGGDERLPMSRNLVSAFVREALKLIMRRLVEAYSTVKKCSNEGRALMQLDFQQLIVKLEKLCDVRPIPDKDYVEAYIKAYYLPDSSIEKWISDHPEYQPKHIVSLLNVMAQVTKKTRTSIILSFGNNLNS